MPPSTVPATDVVNEVYEALDRILAKNYPQAKILLEQGLKKADASGQASSKAVVLSTFGILEKSQGRFREAMKYYEKAEKILPEDPSLKIIMAKLLVDHFAQYDQAIRKMEKVVAQGDPVMAHQAHAIQSLSYLKKGDKKKALALMEKIMEKGFQELPRASAINLDIIEFFLKQNFERETCRRYLEKALVLAKKNKEKKAIALFQQLLMLLGKDN